MDNISLRKAQKGDLMFVFELTNDDACRENSLNSGRISLKEHEDWFERTLDSATRHLYILTEDDVPIGQGRLELCDGKCRLSYSVIPSRRRCGYGRILVELLSRQVWTDLPGIRRCYAEVLPDNVASQKIFEALKTDKMEKTERNGCLVYEFGVSVSELADL